MKVLGNRNCYERIASYLGLTEEEKEEKIDRAIQLNKGTEKKERKKELTVLM